MHPFNFYEQDAANAWELVASNVTDGFERNGIEFPVPFKGRTARDHVKQQINYFKSDDTKNLKK